MQCYFLPISCRFATSGHLNAHFLDTFVCVTLWFCNTFTISSVVLASHKVLLFINYFDHNIWSTWCHELTMRRFLYCSCSCTILPHSLIRPRPAGPGQAHQHLLGSVIISCGTDANWNLFVFPNYCRKFAALPSSQYNCIPKVQQDYCSKCKGACLG